jgi:5-methylthioadenosine/S-adenosylhomocysteine deaminase
VSGEIIYQDGKFTKVDRDAALRQLSELLKRPLSPDEIERRQLSKAVLPHVRSFYEGYYDSASHVPYYRQNSRV